MKEISVVERTTLKSMREYPKIDMSTKELDAHGIKILKGYDAK